MISIIGSPKDLKEIDESFINYQLNRTIINSLAKGQGFPPIDYIEHLRRLYRENLKTFEKIRYFKIRKEFLTNWKYEVEVFVTGEAFNKAVMVRQLNELLLSYARLPGVNIDVDAVFKEILDLMGLGGARFLKTQEETRAIPPVREVPTPSLPRPIEEIERVGETVTAERFGRGLGATIR